MSFFENTRKPEGFGGKIMVAMIFPLFCYFMVLCLIFNKFNLFFDRGALRRSQKKCLCY